METSWMWSIVLLLVTFGVLIGTVSVTVSPFLAVIGLSFAVVSITLVVAIRQRSIDLFEPIVFKSVFMYMVLIALLDRVYLSDRFLRQEDWIDFSFETAFLLLAVLYLVLFVSILYGYYRTVPETNRLRGIFPTSSEYRTDRIRVIALGYMLLGAGAYVLLLGNALNWDPLYLYTTSQPRSQIFADSSSSLLRLLARALYIGFFLHVSVLIAERKSPRLREFATFGLILVLFSLLGGRGLTLQIFLTMAIVLYYLWVKEFVSVDRNHVFFVDPTEKNWMKLAVLPIVGIPIAVVTIMARYIRRADGVLESIVAVDWIRVLTFGINNDRFDYFLVLLSTDEIKYSFGARYFRVPLNFIPRSLWPNKPVLTLGSDLRRLVLPDAAGGRPPGEIGTYYIHFGYPGIVLLGILYGFLLRLTYEILTENSQSPLAIITYAVVLTPFVSGGLTNHSLWGITVNLIWLVPAIVVSRDSLARFHPSRSSSSPQ